MVSRSFIANLCVRARRSNPFGNVATVELVYAQRQSGPPCRLEKNNTINAGGVSAGTMGKKSKAKKKRLAKLERQNSRVPAWVMLKTDMETQRNYKRRNWRRNDTDE